MPEVSVIIPVFNRENFIRAVIKSVLNQTFQDFEIIVVDDASTDGTKGIVKSMQAKDKRIRLIELENNSGGPSIPTNIGIENAQSPFITILESDDLYLPNFLEIRLNYMKKNNLDWTFGGAFYVFLKNSKFIKYVKGASVSTWMLRKDVFEKVGLFKHNQNCYQDLGFSLRVVKFGNMKVQCLPTPLTICFVHSQSNTYFFDDVRNKGDIFVERLKSLLEDASGMKSWEAFIYWKLGNFYCLSGKLREGMKSFKTSFRLRPNVNAFVLYLLSFFGEKFYLRSWRVLWFLKNIFFEKIKLLYYISFKYKKEYLEAQKVLRLFKIQTSDEK